MRETGPVRKRLRGDQERANQYVSQARTLLGILKSTLTPGVLTASKRQNLPGGVVLEVRTSPAGDVITVTAPPLNAPSKTPSRRSFGLACTPHSSALTAGFETEVEDGTSFPVTLFEVEEGESVPGRTHIFDSHHAGHPLGSALLNPGHYGGDLPEGQEDWSEDNGGFQFGNCYWAASDGSDTVTWRGPPLRYWASYYNPAHGSVRQGQVIMFLTPIVLGPFVVTDVFGDQAPVALTISNYTQYIAVEPLFKPEVYINGHVVDIPLSSVQGAVLRGDILLVAGGGDELKVCMYDYNRDTYEVSNERVLLETNFIPVAIDYNDSGLVEDFDYNMGMWGINTDGTRLVASRLNTLHGTDEPKSNKFTVAVDWDNETASITKGETSGQFLTTIRNSSAGECDTLTFSSFTLQESYTYFYDYRGNTEVRGEIRYRDERSGGGFVSAIPEGGSAERGSAGESSGQASMTISFAIDGTTVISVNNAISSSSSHNVPFGEWPAASESVSGTTDKRLIFQHLDLRENLWAAGYLERGRINGHSASVSPDQEVSGGCPSSGSEIRILLNEFELYTTVREEYMETSDGAFSALTELLNDEQISEYCSGGVFSTDGECPYDGISSSQVMDLEYAAPNPYGTLHLLSADEYPSYYGTMAKRGDIKLYSIPHPAYPSQWGTFFNYVAGPSLQKRTGLTGAKQRFYPVARV